MANTELFPQPRESLKGLGDVVKALKVTVSKTPVVQRHGYVKSGGKIIFASDKDKLITMEGDDIVSIVELGEEHRIPPTAT